MERHSSVFLFVIITACGISFAHANPPIEIQGTQVDYLKPSILIQKVDGDWNVEIDFTAQTNFSAFAWLKISSRFGSRLELWKTNGVAVQPTSQEILSNDVLPVQTTVSNILNSFRPANLRPLQWGRARFTGTKALGIFASATFNLQSAFDTDSTNNYILEVKPLIYKVDTNEETAHLIEFPPMKIELKANGYAKKVER